VSEKSNQLNPAAFAVTVFGVVILHKLVSFLTPYKLYFSFSSFLYNQTGALRWQSLALKLALPALFAFVFYVLAYRFLESQQRYGRPADRVLAFVSDALEPSLKMGALFAAILLAWPFLVYWDILIEPTLRDRRFMFVVAYLLYFAAYYFFAGLGVQLAKAYLARGRKTHSLLAEGVGDFSWLAPLRDAAAGAVTSLLASGLTAMAGSTAS
jgi:hypothetical protein